jgi:hypothetical protein
MSRHGKEAGRKRAGPALVPGKESVEGVQETSAHAGLMVQSFSLLHLFRISQFAPFFIFISF